jgi:ABC-type phosphate transport system substrate-binding protein
MKISAYSLLTILGLTISSHEVDAQCFSGSLTFAGSTIFDPVVKDWNATYVTKCKSAVVTGNATGARGGYGAACATAGYVPTDVSNMSRNWALAEANTTDGFTYNCRQGDLTRRMVQVPVAIDGITFVVSKTNKAWTECLSKLPASGLTYNNIRWIYSNKGTDIAQPANSDSNPATYLWSEINTACPAVEIKFGGPTSNFGTFDFFREVSFTASGETFRTGYQSFDVTSAALKDFLVNTEYSSAYSGYSFFKIYEAELNVLTIDGVKPDPTTLANDSYFPWARRIFSNFQTTPAVLQKGVCFLDFIYSKKGTESVSKFGFVPVPDNEKANYKSRFAPYTCPKKRCSFFQRLFRRCPKAEWA